jgi:hypothetical protein
MHQYVIKFVSALRQVGGFLYQVRVITVFTVFRLLTDFVCLYNYEFGLSRSKIVRSSVILLLPLFLRIFRIPPPIKLTATKYLKYC